MWSFKKKKSREDELVESLTKVEKTIEWMRLNDCFPLEIVEDLRKTLTDCARLEKEYREEVEFNIGTTVNRL
jgi:hypothetical protein